MDTTVLLQKNSENIHGDGSVKLIVFPPAVSNTTDGRSRIAPT